MLKWTSRRKNLGRSGMIGCQKWIRKGEKRRWHAGKPNQAAHLAKGRTSHPHTPPWDQPPTQPNRPMWPWRGGRGGVQVKGDKRTLFMRKKRENRKRFTRSPPRDKEFERALVWRKRYGRKTGTEQRDRCTKRFREWQEGRPQGRQTSGTVTSSAWNREGGNPQTAREKESSN